MSDEDTQEDVAKDNLTSNEYFDNKESLSTNDQVKRLIPYLLKVMEKWKSTICSHGVEKVGQA